MSEGNAGHRFCPCRGCRARIEEIGQTSTTLVNVITALSEGMVRFVPKIFVAGGNGSGALEDLAATLTQHVSKLDEKKEGAKDNEIKPAEVKEE